jgi:hypothetical protein
MDLQKKTGGAAYERLELEALVKELLDPSFIVGRLRDYANNELVPAAERLRGCVLLTVVAEDLLSTQLANEARACALSIPSTDDVRTHRLEFEVIYHASFGEVDLCRDPARELLARADAELNPAAQSRMRVTAGSALLRAGLLDEGIKALETCYQVAADHRLLTAQYRAATYLAAVLRDAGQLEVSISWQQMACSAFSHLDEREKLVGFFSNCAAFAIADGQLAIAEHWVKRALAEIPRARVGHAGLHFRALELRIKQLAYSYDCSSAELGELLDAHLRYRGFGHHDAVAEVVWYTLAAKGRPLEANQLLDEYLHRYRRLKWPVTQGLMLIGRNSAGNIE